MTLEELYKKVMKQQADKIAAMTPSERAEFERRRDERRRREEEEYLAKKDKTVPLLEHERDIHDFESFFDIAIDELRTEYEGQLDDLADMALDKLKAQEADLMKARARIDALLDANLKAQDIRRQLDRLRQTTEETKMDVGETRQGVAVLVQHLPDAKKPKTIPWMEAASIFYPSITARKTNGEFCYTKEKRKKMIDSFSRNCRNWIKEGRCPKSGTPISWDDLTSTQTWKTWVEQEKIDARKPRFISEKAGLVEDQRGRRRSPTAQSGK